MKFFAAIVGLLCVFSGAQSVRADLSDGGSEIYGGSTSLPDAIAYKHLLLYVSAHDAGSSHLQRHISQMLGLQLQSRKGAERIADFELWLSISKAEIDSHLAAFSQQGLCSGDRNSMSFQEMVAGLDARKEIRERLYQEHYEATLRELSAEERGSFQAYLNEFKRNISYVRLDNRKFYEDRPQSEIRNALAGICNSSQLNSQR